MENLNSRLKKVFAETLALADVPETLSQKNCPEWDSVNHLNLVIALEAEFDVVFEPEEISAMTDFSVVRSAISKKSEV